MEALIDKFESIVILMTILDNQNLNYLTKTQLQEILQRNGSVKIEYRLAGEEGPEHDKTFTIEVFFNDKKIGTGKGKSKKQAEQEAAHHAIINGSEVFGD